MATATNVKIQREAAGRVIVATWDWSKDNTDGYTVRWWYQTSLNIPYLGEEKTIDAAARNSSYTMPDNAIKVWFHVKPIAKKHDVNGTQTEYWTADWSTTTDKTVWYDTEDYPTTPSIPSVSISNDLLAVSIDGLDLDENIYYHQVDFNIVANDAYTVDTVRVDVKFAHAELVYRVYPGKKYKVRCRLIRHPGRSQNTAYSERISEWSGFSDNVKSIPVAIYSFTKCYAKNETAVFLEWYPYGKVPISGSTGGTLKKSDESETIIGWVDNTNHPYYTPPDSYEIEYTTNKENFDVTDDVKTITIEHSSIPQTHIVTSLESGNTYFFRIRGVNETGKSAWSEIASTAIGTKPQPPTTWSSVTTGKIGEQITLYWVHNSEDGSKETYAEVSVKCGDIERTQIITWNIPEDTERTTSHAFLQLSQIIDGSSYKASADLIVRENGTDYTTYNLFTEAYDGQVDIEWKVRTAGVTSELGDWSIGRSLTFYTPPSVELAFYTNDSEGTLVPFYPPDDRITGFPFYIGATVTPVSHNIIGYYVSITSKSTYETVDSSGATTIIRSGDSVYAKNFDISTNLMLELSASNIDLENNVEYIVRCEAYTESGLSALSTCNFIVAWYEYPYEPDAEIGLDKENCSIYIRPYCEDSHHDPVEGIKLAVYRRAFDGEFLELASGIDNVRYVESEDGSSTVAIPNIVYVTDPHPQLDYARYRVVATEEHTGAVAYYDLPPYPVGEKSVIIQWNETWENFRYDDGVGTLEDRPVSGSLLRLPYNVDVSDSYDPDVSIVEYIGRSHPIGYYGTQKGETSEWSVEIDKSDKDTIYALRRLAKWAGDVYVREPSGSGYWANVKVSFDQKHKSVTIPVKISIKRVEGGI